jgi:hypothetical protein
MILLAGIPSETPIAMVARALEDLGADYRHFNQRHVADCAIAWTTDDSGVHGTLELEDETFDLAQIAGLYLRLMDDTCLPEIEGLAADDPVRLRARGFHETFVRWSEVAPARVVNRAEPQGSNGSKPYQAQLIARRGLLPPPTLVTTDPRAVRAFRADHGRIIYKSISAMRSIVRELDDGDLDRLDAIGWCPVQFQARLDGLNVRVHVVGSKVFPTAIDSTHLDYRYARREGGSSTLRPTRLPKAIADACVALTADLGLAFSGIDLLKATDGQWYCFEVNPSPAFSYFEANTGQPIALALARHLAGMA